MDSGNSKRLSFFFAVGLIGSAALTAQVLLVREILNAFSGNEIVYGLTIFIWMIAYSLGSGVLGRLGHYVKNKLIAFICLQTLIVLLLPAEIYYIRIINNICAIPFGTLIDFNSTLIIIFGVLAPVTLLLGLQFALGSLLLSETFHKASSQISRVYIFEAIGSILGGLSLSYFLIFFLNAFHIAAVLGMLVAFSFLALGKTLPRHNLVLFAYVLLASMLMLFGQASEFNHNSTQASLKNYRLAEVADSPYGRVIVSQYQGAYNFYENGTLLFSTADRILNEETAHLSLLLHPNPRDVLLIGGGVSGTADELLKYPLRSLDCLELDYKVIELAGLWVKAKPGANVLAMDGIRYVQNASKKYDVIIINLPDPTTALINRFYTLEFFKDCKKLLSADGMLTFHLSTSGAYMGRELKLLNQSVYRTVSSIFQYSTVIPGNQNYYFASDTKLSESPELLFTRWRQRNIRTDFFDRNSLYFILWPDKVEYVRRSVAFDINTPLNTEFKPISYFYGLLIWASHFTSPLKNFFHKLTGVSFTGLAVFLLGIFVIIKIAAMRVKRCVLPSAIGLIGFAGMSAQLCIIYTFQALHGYIYQTIGLLTTVYMLGMAVGSYVVYRHYDSIKDPAQAFKSVLWLLFGSITLAFFLLNVIPLPLSPFLISAPIGAAFTLAVKIQEKFRQEIGGLAGILYGSDLLGGALAALGTTIFVIPIFGIIQTFIIAIVFTAAALFIAYS